MEVHSYLLVFLEDRQDCPSPSSLKHKCAQFFAFRFLGGSSQEGAWLLSSTHQASLKESVVADQALVLSNILPCLGIKAV